MDYYSDRELGPKPRIKEDIPHEAWGGIVALIDSLISTGAFGLVFPENCTDGEVTIGNDVKAISLTIGAEIPSMPWPLQTTIDDNNGFYLEKKEYVPDTLAVLDLIEFCHRNVAQPIQMDYHPYFKHYHLKFDKENGRENFRSNINRIFSRNGLAYEIQSDGKIERLAPPIIRESLNNAVFKTDDQTLNRILENARIKYINPNPDVRREALEKLWDAWERIKTLEIPNNKKLSIKQLLDNAATEKHFRTLLEEESKTLTIIGNKFNIRHSEVTQTQIEYSEQVDYLFHRLFSMIQLLLGCR